MPFAAPESHCPGPFARQGEISAIEPLLRGYLGPSVRAVQQRHEPLAREWPLQRRRDPAPGRSNGKRFFDGRTVPQQRLSSLVLQCARKLVFIDQSCLANEPCCETDHHGRKSSHSSRERSHIERIGMAGTTAVKAARASSKPPRRYATAHMAPMPPHTELTMANHTTPLQIQIRADERGKRALLQGRSITLRKDPRACPPVFTSLSAPCWQ